MLSFGATISILLIPLVLFLAHIYLSSRRVYKLGMKLPGEPPLPFFGNVFSLVGVFDHDIVEFLIQKRKIFGTIGRAWLGPHLIVGIANPSDAEVILGSREHLLKSDEYKVFKPWFGNGLLISSGQKWHKDRQIIAPAFHRNVLKNFVDAFNKNSQRVCDEMETEKGKVFDVHDYMSTVMVDTLLETAMGTKKTHQSEESFKYAAAVMKMCDLLHARHITFYLRPDFIFNLTSLKKKQEKLLHIIQSFTSRVFLRKKKDFEDNAKLGKFPIPSFESIIKESNPTNSKEPQDDIDIQDANDVGEKRRLAFLDLLIETAYHNKNMTDAEIKEQVDTIMFEGHDTTAAASSFFLCLMGIYKDVQEKVYEELYRIFGNSDRPATLADTVEMKYLERVLMETLRLYPPVPAIARQIEKDVKVVTNDYILPAGSTVIIFIYEIHRDAKNFPNPEEFNPDNFLPENSQNRSYYSFVPFSAGPRSCVGRKYALLKLKILLSTVLRRYKVHSPVPREQFKLRADIILKRHDGFQLEIEPRKV